MQNYQVFGQRPFKVAVVHGGPGNTGGMNSVASRLSSHNFGVVAPLQTKNSIEQQTLELKEVIKAKCDYPITIIGHSWGAWLSLILTAQFPELTEQLILIGTPPFKKDFAASILPIRKKALTSKEEEKLLNDFARVDQLKPAELKRLIRLIQKADSYHLTKSSDDELVFDVNIFQQVWAQAEKMREDGELIKLASKIKCPVTCIHGKFDPHPGQGVKLPLQKSINSFDFLELDKCGHYPWKEKYACEDFYEIVINLINR
ncbi:MAG: alpha/beta fold hydrolase [Bacteriovoracia bacterium]